MTGVRTGPRALTMMLIPRTDEVETKIIKTSYSHAAGTAHVFFDGARVPVEVSIHFLIADESSLRLTRSWSSQNVLGGEGNGLKVILSKSVLISLLPI